MLILATGILNNRLIMGGNTLALVLCLTAASVVASPLSLVTRKPSTQSGYGSDVPGAAFNRIFQVWLENQNYDVCTSQERPPIIDERKIHKDGTVDSIDDRSPWMTRI